jgi:hypothetical protein
MSGRFIGRCADVAPDTTPDAARTLREVLPYTHVRGWCLTKIPAFPFQKAATNSVRLNVSKCLRGCADHTALNGRSETGSETARVGSELNGRRRSGAWFQERPLSALPYRFMWCGDLSGWFPSARRKAGQSKRREFIRRAGRAMRHPLASACCGFVGVASEPQRLHAGGDLGAGWKPPWESSGPNPEVGPER